MDVKDVQRSAPGAPPRSKGPDSSGRQRSIDSLSGGSARTTKSDSVSVSPDSAQSRGSARAEVNEAINFSNVATEASTKLSALVESVSGIVDQVTDPSVPKERVPVLEKEAKDIVKEIKKAAKDVVDLTPPATDKDAGKISTQIEQAFGETLKRLLPDDVDSGLGLSNLSFSTADNILAVRATVEKARARVEELKGSLDDASKQVRSAAATLEVAIQNGEASEVSIRDLESALSVVNSTAQNIGTDPEQALNSVGSFAPKAKDLLKA